MSRQITKAELEMAYDALISANIAKSGKIEKTFRGQISSFSAAVITGSITYAIAFYSTDGQSSVERKALLDAILLILKKKGLAEESCTSLYDYAKENEKTSEDIILDAALMLKIAMNMFELTNKKGMA